MFTSQLVSFHHPRAYRKVITIGIDHFYLDNRDATAYNQLCAKSLERLLYTLLRKFALICICMSFAYACGFYVNIKNDRRETFFGFKYPGIAAGSELEYGINLTIEISFATFFIMGNITIESVVTLFENSIELSTKIIDMELKNMSHYAKMDRLSNYHMKMKFIDILKQFRRSDGWILQYNEILYWRYFLSPFASTYSIGFCVFTQFVVSLVEKCE